MAQGYKLLDGPRLYTIGWPKAIHYWMAQGYILLDGPIIIIIIIITAPNIVKITKTLAKQRNFKFNYCSLA